MKAVFFDLYNTLARFDPPREQTQLQAARDFGLDLDPTGIARGYAQADAFMTQQNARGHIQKMSREERLAFFAQYERLLLKGAGIDVSEELAAQVWARVREKPSTMTLFPDALPTLQALKERRLIIGLISNIYQDLDALCTRLGLDTYLAFMVSSRSAGAEKPHPPIFLAALEKAQVLPQEALHVGDQYHGDILGARGVGILPLLLDRDGHSSSYQDVERISSLPEVLDYMGPPRP